MVRLTALLSASLVGLTAAITKEKLADFAYYTLDASRTDADKMAAANVKKVNAARLSEKHLTDLFWAMYFNTLLSRDEVRAQFFSVAEDGVDPEVLKAFRKSLYYDCDMDKKQAGTAALELAGIPIDPAPVKDMWQALYYSANLAKPEAQRWVVDLLAAGIEPKALSDAWTVQKGSTSNKGEALKKSVYTAATTSAGGLLARYAKDGHLYSALQFQQYYGDAWLVEWLESPQEKRVANDGKEYSAQEFQKFYGSNAASYWNQASEAPQRRMAEDGQTYTIQEFIAYYKGDWQTKFDKASVVADVCAGLNHEGCDGLPQNCQWKWTGDWTDSCVLKSSTATAAAFLV